MTDGIGPGGELTGPYGEPFTSLPSVHGPPGSLSRLGDDWLAERPEREVVAPLKRVDLYAEYQFPTPDGMVLCGADRDRRADTVAALAGAAGPVDDARLKRLRTRLGSGPRPELRLSLLRERLGRHPVEVGSLDRRWCVTFTCGLTEAEVVCVADLAAERATRTDSEVTEAELEDALQRHLTTATR